MINILCRIKRRDNYKQQVISQSEEITQKNYQLIEKIEELELVKKDYEKKCKYKIKMEHVKVLE